MEGAPRSTSFLAAVVVLLAVTSAEMVKLKSNPDGNYAKGWEEGFISLGRYSVEVPDGEPKERREVQIRAPGVKDSVRMNFGSHTIVFSDWDGRFMLGDRVYTDQLGILYFPTSDHHCDKKTYQIVGGEPEVVDSVKLDKSECERVRAKVDNSLSKFLTAPFEFMLPRAPVKMQHTPGFPGGDYITGMAYGILHCGQFQVELPTGDYEKKRKIKITAPEVDEVVDMVVDYSSKVFGSWDGTFYMGDRVFSVRPSTLVIKKGDGSCVEKVYERDGENVKVKESNLLKDEDCFLIRSKAYSAYQRLLGQQSSDDSKKKERTLIIKMPKETPPPIHVQSTVVLPNNQVITTSGKLLNTKSADGASSGSVQGNQENYVAQVQTNDVNLQNPPGAMYVQQDGNGGIVYAHAPTTPEVNLQANVVDPTQPGSTVNVQANTVEHPMANNILYDSAGQAYIQVNMPQPPVANIQVTNVAQPQPGPVILAESSPPGTPSGPVYVSNIVPQVVNSALVNSPNNGAGSQYTTTTPQGTYVVNFQKRRKKRSVDAVNRDEDTKSAKRVRRSVLQTQQPQLMNAQVMNVDGKFLRQTTLPTNFVNVQRSNITPLGPNGQPIAPDMEATQITSVTMPPGNGRRKGSQGTQPIYVQSKLILDQQNAQNIGQQAVSPGTAQTFGGTNVRANSMSTFQQQQQVQQQQILQQQLQQQLQLPNAQSTAGVNVQLNPAQPNSGQTLPNVQINEVPAGVTYVMNLKTKEIQPLQRMTLPSGQVLSSNKPVILMPVPSHKEVKQIQLNTPQGSTNYIMTTDAPGIPDSVISDIKKLKDATDPTNLIVNIAQSTNFHKIKRKK